MNPSLYVDPDVVPASQAAVLAAVWHLYEFGSMPLTVRRVADAVGLSSTSTVWFHLAALRARGLVTWEPRKASTLRPTFVASHTSPR